MYDPQKQLHDQSGEPNYTNADREEEPTEQKAPLYYYYLSRGPEEPLPLKVDHYEADADHVYVYLKVAL